MDDARFAGLSLRTVLEARDAYHVHLLNLRSVVATAVGRYLARDDEDGGPHSVLGRLALTPGARPPRTLANASLRSWSWPCVLVFVRDWMDEDDIRANPDEMVPRRLYLPDGVQVPTCVVYAPPAPEAEDEPPALTFPDGLVGGGYALLSEVQGRRLVGSVGCLVTDGERLFALTNRHVAGEQGRVLSTLVDGRPVAVGRSAGRSVGRIPFADAYPGFAGERVELAVDAGLVDIDDAARWTTQVFGVGRLGELVDLRPESLDLSLVGRRVRAFGSASGALAGEVAALYYRYATRSGVEYVADAIVAPDGGTTATRPGDSGTVWVLAPDEQDADGAVPVAHPLGLQWGGHRFGTGDGGALAPYALVSFMSTVCRALDVEPVTDWNDRHDRYWGEVGHYTIGARACDLVSPAKLRGYFVANRNRIAFDLADLRAGEYRTDPAHGAFCPLSDVPDRVWKLRGAAGRAHEGPNHFADMDDPLPQTDDTLLRRFTADSASLTPESWLAFYEARGVPPRDMGLLPFRIGQLYGVMVDALVAGQVDRALAAAGVMAHYVGDACQPLHASWMHDGRTPEEEGVHAAYETAMVTTHRGAIIDGLDQALATRPRLRRTTGATGAAGAAAALMRRSLQRLPPARICDAYARSHRSDDLWDALGADTVACLADGCRTLAALWSSAWAEAKTPAPAAVPADKVALQALYNDRAFAPSMYLTELVAGHVEAPVRTRRFERAPRASLGAAPR